MFLMVNPSDRDWYSSNLSSLSSTSIHQF